VRVEGAGPPLSPEDWRAIEQQVRAERGEVFAF
jgi:hypothetical protein